MKNKKKDPIRNAIVIAMIKRHGGGTQAHKSRNQRRSNRQNWKKEQW